MKIATQNKKECHPNGKNDGNKKRAKTPTTTTAKKERVELYVVRDTVVEANEIY